MALQAPSSPNSIPPLLLVAHLLSCSFSPPAACLAVPHRIFYLTHPILPMKIRITLLSLLFVSGMQAQDLRLTDTAAYLSQARIPLNPPLSFFFEKLGKPDRVRTAEGT